MKLSTRIILVSSTALLVLSTVLTVISVNAIRRTSERHLEAYLTLGLNHYLQEYPERFSRLLESHGLEDVDSFREYYQEEALAAATKTELRMSVSIYVIAVPSGETPVVLTRTNSSTGLEDIVEHLEEHTEQNNSDERTIHFDSASGNYHLFTVFEPWNWIVGAVAPEAVVRAEIGKVLPRTVFSTTIVVLVTAIGLSILLTRLFLRPVLRIAGMAQELPSGKQLRLDETERGDELGALARDIVGAGETIQRTQTELREMNADLERTVEARTAELAEALDQQKMLVREVHHRVKNNMVIVQGLLGLHRDSSSGAGMDKAISEIQDRIASMTLIHEQLYRGDGGLNHVDSKVYLESLITQLQHSFADDARRLVMRAEIESVPLKIEVAMPCGLITNELVSNSVKYAFPEYGAGTIIVRFSEIEDGVLGLSVSDDGVGLNGEQRASDSQSIGIGGQLVLALAGQLDGTVSAVTENGFTVTVRFPKPAERAV